MPANTQLGPGKAALPLFRPPVISGAVPRNVFVVCSGESCRHAGSHRLLGLLQRRYGQKCPGHDVRISSSKCLNHCGLAPAMVENGRVMGWVSLRRLKSELLRLGLFETSGRVQ